MSAIAIARIVLAAPAVLGGRDLLRMQRRARHALRAASTQAYMARPVKFRRFSASEKMRGGSALSRSSMPTWRSWLWMHLRHLLAHAVAGRGRESRSRRRWPLALLAHAVRATSLKPASSSSFFAAAGS